MIFTIEDINGSLVNNFTVCRKKAWLSARRIHANQMNMHLQMGSVYNSARNTQKRFGNIEVDSLSKEKHVIVKEYKKTFSNIEASKQQLIFYMHTLKSELNLKKIEGLIISEETNEKYHIDLTQDVEDKIVSTLQDMVKIINDKKLPVVNNSELCNYCGHNFYCL